MDPFKFAPPSLDGTLPRRALLERLAAIAAPAKWLCAPSGSGKSTLIAAYARAAKCPVIWYRFDARDDDPGFFFPALAGTLSERSQRAALPRFSDADHGHETAFAARFFNAALARETGPALIVLDDVQRASADWLVDVLARLVEQIPPGVEVVFISDAPPSPPFFDAIVARRLALANDIDLSFTADECDAIAQLLRLSAMRGEDLLAVTGGHAGAVVLACEFLRSSRSARVPAESVTRQIHTHLLGKLVDQLPPELRDVLLRTSSLPRLTALLVGRLLNRDDADRLLETLAERGLLMRFATGEGMAYEAHGLVRAGAQTLAQQELGAAGAKSVRERCAELLQANELLEDAFALWVDLGQQERALDVLERLAARFAQQRQSHLLLKAIERLPAATVAPRFWISFWAGQALLGVDERSAVGWFGRSFTAFEVAGDRCGMALAAASALSALSYDMSDTGAIGRWLERFAASKAAGTAIEDKRLRAIFLLGFVCEANLAADATADAAQNEAAFRELLDLALDAEAWNSRDQMLTVATLLVEHALRFYPRAFAHSVITATRPLAEDAQNNAGLRAFWWLEVAQMHADAGDAVRVSEFLAAVERLAAEADSRTLWFQFWQFKTDYALRRGETIAADTAMAEFERRCAGGTPRELAMCAVMATRLLLQQRRFPEALARAEGARAIAETAGFVGVDFKLYEMTYANALAANGRLAEAAQCLHVLASRVPQGQRDYYLSMAHCLDACKGGEIDVVSLKLGMEIGSSLAFLGILQRTPDLMSRICAAALENDIEPEYVRRVIAHQRLTPPSSAGPRWPWRVRVWALGRFQLELDGKPYRPSHKAQDKPLDLLKLLLACQASGVREPEKRWLAEQLWPDADVANARKSLDMTVARLRRVLSLEEAIDSVEGRLLLSKSYVWTDVSLLQESLAAMAVRRDARIAGRDSEGSMEVELNAALSAYGGQLLPGEDETPWLLGARTHLSRAFCAAVVACESLVRPDGRDAWLMALERALLVEPAAEDLARAAMRAYLGQGKHSEALRVYRRLRDMLSVVMGVTPSAQTDALRQEIYRAAEAGKAAVQEANHVSLPPA